MSSAAVGFLYLVKSSLLELSKLLRVELSPVERADAGHGPMITKTVGAFDDGILGVGLDGSLVGA